MKYEYWQMLKCANEEYRQLYSHHSFEEEKAGFEFWTQDQWGLDVSVEADGHTPYYTVKNENKYLLFQLMFSSK